MSCGGYLDHNATTPLRPEALAAVTEALANVGNPSSVHRFGRGARKLLEDARRRVAALVSVAPSRVVFTSGGTEANALALRGSRPRRILASAVEHVSVLDAVEGVTTIPVDRTGVVDFTALDAMLGGDQEPALVSVMLANNETGVIQPVNEVVALARRHGARVHCDAVQAAGKIPVDFVELEVDLLTLSAHKLGGPVGTGALIVGDGVPMSAVLRGGGQERWLRAGTENLPGIAGFGAAAEVVAGEISSGSQLARWRDDVESRIGSLAPDASFFGSEVRRLPNTTCVGMPGVASEVQVMALDLAGVAVSAGAACSSGKVTRSHVLKAMGVSEGESATAIRVSLGWTTTDADIDAFVEAWGALYRRNRTRHVTVA